MAWVEFIGPPLVPAGTPESSAISQPPKKVSNRPTKTTPITSAIIAAPA
jgi:hypothetical protein